MAREGPLGVFLRDSFEIVTDRSGVSESKIVCL
jgi:hypothetical protein